MRTAERRYRSGGGCIATDATRSQLTYLIHCTMCNWFRDEIATIYKSDEIRQLNASRFVVYRAWTYISPSLAIWNCNLDPLCVIFLDISSILSDKRSDAVWAVGLLVFISWLLFLKSVLFVAFCKWAYFNKLSTVQVQVEHLFVVFLCFNLICRTFSKS